MAIDRARRLRKGPSSRNAPCLSPPDPWLGALKQGLHDLGYVEGKGIVFENDVADGRNDRLDGLAQELIFDSKADVLVAMMGLRQCRPEDVRRPCRL